MRPGAFLLVTVPANLGLWSRHDESFGHYRRYDARRLAQVWEGLPVRPLLTSYFNSRLYPLVKLVRTINRWRGEASGVAGTDFRIPARPVNRFMEAVFAGESRRLCRKLHGRGAAYRQGVSLIALLERECGSIQVRGKPATVAIDYFDPAAAVA